MLIVVQRPQAAANASRTVTKRDRRMPIGRAYGHCT